jgi:hypothetical protein
MLLLQNFKNAGLAMVAKQVKLDDGRAFTTELYKELLAEEVAKIKTKLVKKIIKSKLNLATSLF